MTEVKSKDRNNTPQPHPGTHEIAAILHSDVPNAAVGCTWKKGDFIHSCIPHGQLLSEFIRNIEADFHNASNKTHYIVPKSCIALEEIDGKLFPSDTHYISMGSRIVSPTTFYLTFEFLPCATEQIE